MTTRSVARNDRWSQLERAYASEGLVFVLGAGVSLGTPDETGHRVLPTWIELLERLRNDAADGTPPVVELVAAGWSLPMIADLVAGSARGTARDAAVERVRAALYRDLPFFPDGTGKSNRRQFVRFVDERIPTLRTVAAFCAVRNESGRYDPNPLVHAVLTLNIDALLQAYDYARHEKRLLRTVERASAGARRSKISLFHLHGFLRFDGKARDPTKESHDLVLTEREYFDFFAAPNSVFNYVVLFMLREHHCVFVGLSMLDENLRRLLHLSTAERMLALDGEGVTGREAERRAARHYAVLRRAQPALDRAVEESLWGLGTRVLWVDDYAELSERFGAVYDAGGYDWPDVF